MSTSDFAAGALGARRLFVYLQRPDTGEWATVGRYLAQVGLLSSATFEYAPSYLDAGHTWSIDPVNLPCIAGQRFAAPRYLGLHDVLRDACPDAWGQAVLRRETGLPEDASPLRYLIASGNADRWGALAVGASARPSVASLSAPRLPQLPELIEELQALSEGRPAVRAGLRKRLVRGASSVGGANPKATVCDDAGRFWLAKPRMAGDYVDVPRLEHAAHRWGAACGLRFAPTELVTDAAGALLVLRFDREAGRRRMCVSAASLLQVEYPGDYAHRDRASYPRLAEELRRIGAPAEDRIELFGRMIFNAMCGNDDDHVRNHAVVWSQDEGRWRLSPAFDVVPNPAETPRTLTMQVSAGRFDISREAFLADAHRFGFDSRTQAEKHLDGLVLRIARAFEDADAPLGYEWKEALSARLRLNQERLSRRDAPT